MRRICRRCAIRAEEAVAQNEPICNDNGLVGYHSYIDVPEYQVAEQWHGWDGSAPLIVVKLYLPLAGFGYNRYGCRVYLGGKDIPMGSVTDTPTRWTPAKLVETFCSEEFRSGFRKAQTNEHSEWSSGFCSYAGKNAYGPGIHGFDDGWDFASELSHAGWLQVSGTDSQYPYSQTLVWRALESDPRWALASYCEGDFGVEVYDSEDALDVAIIEVLCS